LEETWMTRADAWSEIADVLALESTLDNLGGDPELLRELLQFFLEIAPQQLDELQAVVAAGDTAAVSLQAHSMKGGAANVGAVQMAATARELEMLARGGSLTGAEALAARLRTDFANLQAVLPRVDWQALIAG
jgi:HPt (histidine-containing phosphotransfer) domain-containing protein